MTPQEYMDLPFAGMAASKLAENGLWDEDVGKPVKKWTVQVSGYVEETNTYTIKARSEDEACSIAEDECASDFDHTDIEVINIEELKK